MSLSALAWAWEIEGLDPTEKLVLLCLADAHNEMTERCHPSRDRVMRRVGIGLTTVKRHLRKLEERGLIERRPSFDDHGRQRSNDYALVTSRGAMGGPPEGAAGAPGEGAAGAPQNRKKEREEEPESGPDARAREILGAWNELTGQRLRARQWLRMIAARVRAYPELELADHREVIERNLASKWWRGEPTPNLVYGTDAQFERCMLRGATPDVGEAVAATRARFAELLGRRAA